MKKNIPIMLRQKCSYRNYIATHKKNRTKFCNLTKMKLSYLQKMLIYDDLIKKFHGIFKKFLLLF